MPELPEIVAHAERLNESFAGKTLKRFIPLHISALKNLDPSPESAHGLALSSTGYRGKYLLLSFGDGDCTFIVHLMQGGRLRPDAAQKPRPRNGLARWTFDDDTALLLTEAGTEKRAGVWLSSDGQSDQFEGLGPDADKITCDELAERLGMVNERIHGFLRHQSNLAGIGRLLANEVLYEARLSPFAMSAKLDDDDIDRLHEAIGSMMTRALDAERELSDIGPSKDRPSDVHHRVGEQCRRCEDTIRSVEYRRYTIAYCPTCQTGGKVLADNTTSRFLK